MAHLLIWLTYYALHSLFAADGFKNLVRRTLPAVYARYRLWYSATAGILLLPVLWFGWQLPGPRLFAPQYGGVLLVVAGSWITLASFRNYDVREFLGMGNQNATSPETLRTTGLNAWVRHPLYSGALCFFLGGALFFPYAASWWAVLALLVYLPFGICFEEKKLIRTFGDQYRVYRKRVKAVIPGVI